MKLFIKNHCRFCKKVFCCENCRLKHEKKIHKILPECDFCNFGRLYKNAELSEVLKEHINEIHFPLKCKSCLKVLKYLDELLYHIKHSCNNTTLITPHKNENNEENHKTKLITPLVPKNNNCVTSTPINKTEQNIISEMITPVNVTESKLKNSCIKLTPILYNNANKGDTSTKRKVTFCETIEKIKEYKTEDDVITINEVEINKEVKNKLNTSNDRKVQDNVEDKDILWKTAFEEFDDSNKYENILNETIAEIDKENSKIVSASFTTDSTKSFLCSEIWSSVSSFVKSIVNFSDNENENRDNIYKRSKPDDEDDIFDIKPIVKKRKYSTIQCRRTIHPIFNANFLPRKLTCDKATQTD